MLLCFSPCRGKGAAGAAASGEGEGAAADGVQGEGAQAGDGAQGGEGGGGPSAAEEEFERWLGFLVWCACSLPAAAVA